jgi:hypothetical protein
LNESNHLDHWNRSLQRASFRFEGLVEHVAGRGWVVRMVVRAENRRNGRSVVLFVTTDTIICSDCEAPVGSLRAFSQPTMKAADVGLPDAAADGSTLKTARRHRTSRSKGNSKGRDGVRCSILGSRFSML